jgi:multidrug efflux system outer membrane protein
MKYKAMIKNKKHPHIFLRTILITFLLFSACAIGPDYKVPNNSLPKSFNTENVEAAKKQNIPDTPVPDRVWWQGFEDKLLEELLENAVENSNQVGQALARVNQSRALARESFSKLFPSLLLNANYEESRNSAARFPNGGNSFNFEVYTGSIDTTWELDIFGRLRRDLESKNAEYAANVYNLQDELRILISEMAITYIQLRSAQNQERVAKKNKDLQSKTLELIQTKYDLGVANELDLQRAKAELAKTQAVIPPLAALVKINAHRLSVLSGMPPTALYAKLLTPQNNFPEYKGPLTINAPETLLRNRPDIRRAERMLASNNAKIGIALGELFPKISLRGSLGIQAAQFSALNSGADIFSFGPSISWAAFDTGRLRSLVEYAEQLTEESLRAYQQRVLLALEETENALVNYSKQSERAFQLEKAFEASLKAFESADLQYTEGQLDFLSVLDIQRTLLSTELEQLVSSESKLIALVGIYKALGSGWENIEAVTFDLKKSIATSSDQVDISIEKN